MVAPASVFMDTKASIVTWKQTDVFLIPAWMRLYASMRKEDTRVCPQQYSGVNCELDIDKCGSWHRMSCIRLLWGLTSVAMYLDALETTVNSTLMNAPISNVSIETTTTLPAQVVNSQGHIMILWSFFVVLSLVTMMQHVRILLAAIFVSAALDTQVACWRWT